MTFSVNKKNALLVIGVLLIVFVILVVTGTTVWEYTNSDSFCTNVCHSVHPEEAYSHKTSQHARVTCAECHIGRIPTLKAIAVKSTHTLHAWHMLVGYHRPLSSPSLKSSEDSCENCHSDQPHQFNSIRRRTKYDIDRANSKMDMFLVMHNVRGMYKDDPGKGIGWHTENEIRFIATDPLKQTIPWMEVMQENGDSFIYIDTANPLDESEIAGAKRHVMNCLDCHNRVAHPFPNPEREVDRALAEGKLNSTFPYVKARLVALFDRDFSTEEEAMQFVEEAWAVYGKDFPDLAEKYPVAYAKAQEYMKERQQLVVDLMVRSKFKDLELSWRSFPDNTGHKDFGGCFRCHDGRHLSAAGKPVPMNCFLCHTIPIVIKEGNPLPDMRIPFGQSLPAGHSDPDFPLSHPDLLDDTCKECHEILQFGSGNESFCSNVACHGIGWSGIF